MRINVFGPGGVGGYLAARLAASGTAEVSVIARGAHLDAIREHGLRLESPDGNLHEFVRATGDPATVGPVDIVLLTVKDTDTRDAAEQLGPLLGAETVVVTFQNGVDSPGRVADVIGGHAVLPGVAYIFSTLAAPGVVRHTAGPGRFVFGPVHSAQRAKAGEVGAALTAGGVDNKVVDDVDTALWSKFAIICATAGVTSCSRLPIDVLRQDRHTRQLFRDLAAEVVAVGRASGVALPENTVDHTMDFVASIGPNAYSSLLYDLEHGKPMELETLHGSVVQRASALGVHVPVSRAVYALLSPWARRNAERTGAPDHPGSRHPTPERQPGPT